MLTRMNALPAVQQSAPNVRQSLGSRTLKMALGRGGKIDRVLGRRYTGRHTPEFINNQLKGVPVSPAKSNRGRPVVHTEPWAKITVVLLDRHVAYLDRLAIDIRLRHGKAISRAEIIRGLIEASKESGVDLSQADSIDTIVELLTTKKKSAR